MLLSAFYEIHPIKISVYENCDEFPEMLLLLVLAADCIISLFGPH